VQKQRKTLAGEVLDTGDVAFLAGITDAEIVEQCRADSEAESGYQIIYGDALNSELPRDRDVRVIAVNGAVAFNGLT
jgi:hypothetical protein